jgi:hypothetical protein
MQKATTVLILVPDRGWSGGSAEGRNKYKRTYDFCCTGAWIGPVRPNLHFNRFLIAKKFGVIETVDVNAS